MPNKSTRRDFLKHSAVIATGALILPQIIPSTALGLGGKLPPSDRIVVGAIGTGQRGMANLRDFLGRLKDVQFVSVCDVDTNHAFRAKELIYKANKNSDCRIFGDYREFPEKVFIRVTESTILRSNTISCVYNLIFDRL